MSSVLKVKDATLQQDVESVIEAIKAAVKLLDCVVMVDTIDPEVSGIVSDGEERYRDVVPLGDGVHIVLSVGSLPTKLSSGIHEVKV